MNRAVLQSPAPSAAAAALPAVAFFFVACGDRPPGHTFEIVDEDGVQVAVNSGIPRYEGEIFVYDKILEIRPDPAVPESMLFRPVAYTLGDDGRYYVADTGNHRVAVFDAAGRFVQAIGREGEGPGELQDPWGVSVRDGVLTVLGTHTSRFRTDGTFLDRLPGAGNWVYRSRDDRLVVFNNPQGPGDDGYYHLGIDAVVRALDGSVLAEVSTPQRPWAKLGADGTRYDFLYFFRPGAVFTAADEIAMSAAVAPEIDWYGLDGALRRKVRINLEPEPLTAADRARAEAHYDAQIAAALAAGQDDFAARVRDRKANAAYADPKGPWQGVVIETSGWVWLSLPAPNVGMGMLGVDEVEEPQGFRIVDPRGEYVGITHWPSEVRFFGSTPERGHLLAMIPDPVTEETVPTVYAIRSAVPEFDYPGTER